MPNPRRHVTTCCTVFTVLMLGGCSNQPHDKSPRTSATASTDADPRNLAWLGGTASPLAESIAIVDPDNENNELYPGGLVVRSVEKEGQLAKMKLRAGDVISRCRRRAAPDQGGSHA